MLKVSVVGHRDLKEECIEYYSIQVRDLLKKLKQEYENILVFSSIADGADRLVIKEAISLDIKYKVVLPFQKSLYKLDFDDDSKKEFDYLLRKSSKIINIPLIKNNTNEKVSKYGYFRDLQYEASANYLVDNCDILIALWDKKYNNLIGGTSESVKTYLSKKNYKLFLLYVSRKNDEKNNMIKFQVIKGNINESK